MLHNKAEYYAPAALDWQLCMTAVSLLLLSR